MFADIVIYLHSAVHAIYGWYGFGAPLDARDNKATKQWAPCRLNFPDQCEELQKYTDVGEQFTS